MSNEEENLDNVYKQKTNISPIVKFFIQMTGLQPTKDQVKLLTEAITKKYHKILISAGRQSGKTICTAVILLYYVFKYDKPVKILLVSAQDNIVYHYMVEIFKKHPEFVEELTELSKTGKGFIPIKGFETKKGSIVNVKNATDKAVFGFPADIVVLDEACKIDNGVYLSALGCITEGSSDVAKYILLSTPDEDKSLFVQWFFDKESGFRVYTWSGENLHWHNKEIEALKKRTMTPEVYATQVLGRPKNKEERAFFSNKNIDDCTLENVEAIREGGVNSIVEGGLDCGYGFTVLTFTEKIGSVKRKILEIDIWERQSIEEIAPEIARAINRMGAYITKVDSKAGINVPSYTKIIKKYTTRTLINIDASHKDKVINDKGEEELVTIKWHMLGQLGRKLREKNLIIPMGMVNADILIDQLKKYNPRRGRNDDIVDSLALSCYEPPVPFSSGLAGKWYIGIPNNSNYNGLDRRRMYRYIT